jgi:hypothetical protein
VAVLPLVLAMILTTALLVAVRRQEVLPSPQDLVPPGLRCISVPTPKTTADSLYGNFIDLSSKEQKLLWRKMVKPDADFVPLNMTVTNSKAIIDLFTDKAISFHWMRFMRIPLIGDGITGSTPNKTPSGHEMYNTTLSVFKNLIKDFNHLTLDKPRGASPGL